MAIFLSDRDIPLSKSIIQRLLIMDFLARHFGDCRGIIPAGFFLDEYANGDSRHLQRALVQLAEDGMAPIAVGEGGTSLRFLAAISAVWPKPFVLTGLPKLGQRPLEPLLVSLGHLGVRNTFNLQPSGAWSLSLRGPAEMIPEILSVDCHESSQFLSSLLLVAPYLPGGLTLQVAGIAVSRSYVEMTVRLMEKFGITIRRPAENIFKVEPGSYQPSEMAIPLDWSAAAFIFAASWMTSQSVEIAGLIDDGLQGDSCFSALLSQVAAGGADLDLTDCPDLLPPLVICALFAPGPTVFHGIAHTELKESPRATLLTTELGHCGARLHFDGRVLSVSPGLLTGGVVLNPHNDHRLAMAFGLLGLRLPMVTVTNKECVQKSYPAFWEVLERFK